MSKRPRRLLRRAGLAVAVIGSALVAPMAAPAEPAQLATANVVPGQALVRFRPEASGRDRAAAHERLNATILRTIPETDYHLVSLPAGLPLDRALRTYRSNHAVAVAEANYKGRIALSPDDACHAEPCAGIAGQWHLRNINTPFGWDAFPGGTYDAERKLALHPVTIAVLDTKIDPDHPDWVNPGSGPDAATGGQLDLEHARDWVPRSRQSGSAAYHGTFVAGLAGAATGNGRGVAGVGYAARLLPLTVVDGGGFTDAATLAEAIVYAWRRGARVINLSLGIAGDSRAIHDAIRLVTKGDERTPASLVVAAAGNNTANAPFYPGSYREVMSVSGTDAEDGRATCSNYNGNVSVSAPADRLVGLQPTPIGQIQAPCGTSAAAPQVAGLAALLFLQSPERTPSEVRSIIERSADDLGAPGRDDHFGWGRINVERALRRTGPQTTDARATEVGANGGVSTVTATARSARSILRAEAIFLQADATAVPLEPADDSYGGTTEALRGTIRIPRGLPAGAHSLWVRAHDGVQWGPATVTTVVIDSRAPRISGASVTNALRATGHGMVVGFTALDDRTETVSFGIEFRSSATGQIVHRTSRFDVPAGSHRYSWAPPLSVPVGHYRIKLAVADAHGNTSSTELGALVT